MIPISAEKSPIPPKSKAGYYRVYSRYLLWKKRNGIDEYCNDEGTLRRYMEVCGKHMVGTSLAVTLSKLKAVIAVELNQVLHTKSLQFLVNKWAADHVPTPSPGFEATQIAEFLARPDEKRLVSKVVVILGYCGDLRKTEIHNLKLSDVRVSKDAAIVRVDVSKANRGGSFVITDETEGECMPLFSIFRRYYDLRMAMPELDQLLVQVRNGKCWKQNVGVNKIRLVATGLATELGLPEPQKYTSHSYRRSLVITSSRNET